MGCEFLVKLWLNFNILLHSWNLYLVKYVNNLLCTSLYDILWSYILRLNKQHKIKIAVTPELLTIVFQFIPYKIQQLISWSISFPNHSRSTWLDESKSLRGSQYLTYKNKKLSFQQLHQLISIVGTPPPTLHKGGLPFPKLVEMGEVQTLLLEIGVEVGFEMVGFMIFLIYFLLFGL